MDYEDLQEENLNFDERLTNLEHQFSKLSRRLDFFLPLMGGAILIILWKIFF